MDVDVVEHDLPSPNVISDEVIPYLNMLHLEVLHRIESNLDGTFIVTQKRHFVTSKLLNLGRYDRYIGRYITFGAPPI